MKGLCFVLLCLIIESIADSRDRFSFSQFARQQDGTNGNGNGLGNGNGNGNGNKNGNGNGYGPPTDSYGPPTQTTEAPSGPYPPSGWKPNGELLLLPGETHSSLNNGNGNGNGNGVDTTYGPPPPSSQYGPASKPSTTTEAYTTTSTTTQRPTPDPDATTDVDNSNANPGNENGQYYVLLPDGKLQRVKYSGKKKGRKQYEALVEYELVDPIKSPVYTYQGIPLNFS